MTPACIAALSLSLSLYLSAALLFQGYLWFHRMRLERWGHRLLSAGVVIHVLGLVLHFLFSGRSPVSSMVVVVSLAMVVLLTAALLIERLIGLRHLSLLAAPLAFLVLLYALLMPVRFEGVEFLLFRHPWLGIHVAFALMGEIGFALAFCSAVAYLVQHGSLKQGRLNRYLPPLDAAASATYYFAAIGFSLFSLGLAMGVIWLFGAPGEYLEPRDAKIWMALPTWLVFAVYLYGRRIARRRGIRLKWLVIAGFLLALANLLGVRHGFSGAAAAGRSVGAIHLFCSSLRAG